MGQIAYLPFYGQLRRARIVKAIPSHDGTRVNVQYNVPGPNGLDGNVCSLLIRLLDMRFLMHRVTGASPREGVTPAFSAHITLCCTGGKQWAKART